MQKKYVSVNAEVDTDGVIRPLLIRWHDGDVYKRQPSACRVF